MKELFTLFCMCGFIALKKVITCLKLLLSNLYIFATCSGHPWIFLTVISARSKILNVRNDTGLLALLKNHIFKVYFIFY